MVFEFSEIMVPLRVNTGDKALGAFDHWVSFLHYFAALASVPINFNFERSISSYWILFHYFHNRSFERMTSTHTLAPNPPTVEISVSSPDDIWLFYNPARLELLDLTVGSDWPGGQFDYSNSPAGSVHLAGATETGSAVAGVVEFGAGFVGKVTVIETETKRK